MRYAHAGAPRWSKYDIGEAERDLLAAQIVAMAAALGFDLPVESIRAVKLMENGDALCIDLDGETTKGTAGRHYVQYPMADRDGPDDPVTLKATAAHDLITFLHEQRWRQERRRAIAGLTGGGLKPHEDGDVLTRWSCALRKHDPARIAKLRVMPMQFREISHQCRTTLRTAVGEVKLDGDAMVLPFMVPETLAGAALRLLGRLIDFPTCGDAAIDQEIADIMIFELESAKASSSNPAHTTIKLLSQRQAPLIPGANSPWRRLRAIRPIILGKAPDYIEPDLPRGRDEYHATCDAALGGTTTLPVRLDMAVAP